MHSRSTRLLDAAPDMLQINRALAEGDGDRLTQLLASYVETEGIVIGDTALLALVNAVAKVRKNAG